MIKTLEAEESPKDVARTRDRQTVERREAFDRFTQSRLERAYRLAGIILRDRSAAEDAVHEAAINAYRHWDDLRDKARLDAWFDRILVNECRAQLRRRRVRPLPGAFVELASAPDPLAALAERDRVYRALSTLDSDHRITVVLRYVADLDLAEVAARTGVPEGTVKSRLHYARRQMRAALEAAERTPGGHR